MLVASTAALLVSTPSAPRSIVQAIILCAMVLGYEKTVTALFSNKCVEDFIPAQRHIEVLIDQSASRKSPDCDKESHAKGWRSM